MKSDWKSSFIDLGTIVQKNTVTVGFEALRDLEIESVQASCGCSKPLYDSKNRRVLVNYTPFEVPIHLRYQGYYNPTQTITVYYKDGTTDSLSFTAKVVIK